MSGGVDWYLLEEDIDSSDLSKLLLVWKRVEPIADKGAESSSP